MAREMALAGVDAREFAPPPPPEKPRTFEEKWHNFWYHYKIAFWIVAVLLAIAITIIVQTVTADPADYNVVVVTEAAMYTAEQEALVSYLAAKGSDLDGDGKVEVSLENLVPSFDADGTTSIGFADQQKLINYIAAGEKMLFVFDELSYQGFCDSIALVTSEGYEFFAPLDTASAAYDPEQHYVRLDIDFGAESVFADLLIGVRTPEGTAGNRESVTLYEQGKVLAESLAD